MDSCVRCFLCLSSVSNGMCVRHAGLSGMGLVKRPVAVWTAGGKRGRTSPEARRCFRGLGFVLKATVLHSGFSPHAQVSRTGWQLTWASLRTASKLEQFIRTQKIEDSYEAARRTNEVSSSVCALTRQAKVYMASSVTGLERQKSVGEVKRERERAESRECAEECVVRRAAAEWRTERSI